MQYSIEASMLLVLPKQVPPEKSQNGSPHSANHAPCVRILESFRDLHDFPSRVAAASIRPGVDESPIQDCILRGVATKTNRPSPTSFKCR